MPRKLETAADLQKAREYGRQWYRLNASNIKAKKDSRRRDIRQWFEEYKAQLVCANCGESHPATLEFHHRDPKQKEMSLSEAVHNGWSRSRLLKEIAKCDVLCANCHIRLHTNFKI